MTRLCLSLESQFARAAKSFKKKDLSALLARHEGEVALLVIDVQNDICDPKTLRGTKTTKAISERIKSIAPQFREAGVPIYAFYYADDKLEGKPYKFKPTDDDTVITKNRNSAFEGSTVEGLLRHDGKRLLLVSGFNLSACVVRTAIDARTAGFEVCVLTDMTGNDSPCSFHRGVSSETVDHMQQAGIIFASSNRMLKQLTS